MTTTVQQIVADVPGYTPSLYANIRELIDAGLDGPPAPEIMACNDGVGLFYSACVNSVFGDPESGKTWVVLAAAADLLLQREPKPVLFLDLDHNGAAAIVARLFAFGVPKYRLSDPAMFRYCEPESPQDIHNVIQDAALWRPALVAIDSLGELLPIYGASSNSADDYTRVHKTAVKPFAQLGTCVVVVDHEAKNAASREYGAGGTMAKKRAVDGSYLRCRAIEPFTPGFGGTAELTVVKDRHGGLRAARGGKEREPLAAKFTLTVPPSFPDSLEWRLTAPAPGEQAVGKQRQTDDRIASLVKRIEALDPPAASASDAARRIEARRQDVFEAFKLISSGNVPGTSGTPVPSSQPPISGTGNPPRAVIKEQQP